MCSGSGLRRRVFVVHVRVDVCGKTNKPTAERGFVFENAHHEATKPPSSRAFLHALLLLCVAAGSSYSAGSRNSTVASAPQSSPADCCIPALPEKEKFNAALP